MCPHCHAGNPQGTLFCVACALPLAQPAPGPQASAWVVPAGPPAPPHGLRLVAFENLQPTGQTLTLPDTAWAGTLLLGRQDLAAGVVVDLDLAALGGFEKRVSRRHARLHYVTRPGGGPNEVRVEDWDSAHGTWLNKTRLPRGASEPLHDGDELRFAELIFRVALT